MVIPGIKGMSLREFLKILYRHWEDDAVPDKAAQLSYYFLFALFPLLFFLVTLAAYLPLGGAVQQFLQQLSDLMPSQAYEVLKSHLEDLLNRPRPKLLTSGLLIAIWSASRGVDAVRTALNLAYDVKESRPFWKTQGLALLMTVLGAVLVLIAITMIALGGEAGAWLAEKANMGREFQFTWSYLRWPATALVIMLALALTYYLLPDVEQEFKFITPGSVIGTILWLLATWGFTQYVGHFGNYNVTYGSIGGVIVLMTWLYITGLIFILGGEINVIIEHASAEGKEPGARTAGEVPPPLSERASAAPPGAAKSATSARRSRFRFLQLFGRRSRADKPI